MLLANGRIYVDLGDKFLVNFSDIAHMESVRETYKKVVRRGAIGGWFTEETVAACRRRLNLLVEALAECKRLRELGHAITES